VAASASEWRTGVLINGAGTPSARSLTTDHTDNPNLTRATAEEDMNEQKAGKAEPRENHFCTFPLFLFQESI
jgi:hypothetical protein